MEEQSQKECKIKGCCGKCIIIVVVCSLLCFFAGYYAGTKSLAKVSGAAINRPFNPNRTPRIPPNIPNIPKIQNTRMQRPPVIPQTQTPKVNIPDSVKAQAQAQATKNAEQKK